MIALKQVAKTPPRGRADGQGLSGIDLGVGRGDFLVLTGATARMRTALLRIIGLLDRPDAGSYALEGREVARLGDRERARLRSRRFGFVFREPRLLDELDVEGNIMLPMAYAGMPRHLRSRRAKELLDRVGLASRGKTHPASLSEHEGRLAAIARALANDPICLLVDDAGFSGEGDDDEKLRDLLASLHAEGLSILLSGGIGAPLVEGERLIRMTPDRVEELACPVARKAG
ncbi:MAG: ATP-binding cassette domain-containing protein [Treponema sp.]|nr:ATP-binding cassette domain-containing protein [Treponema sp.]